MANEVNLSPPEQNIMRELCRRDAHAFIFGIDTSDGHIHFLKTKNEHDAFSPVQNFPDYPYLRCMVDMLLVGGGFIEAGQATYCLSWGLSKSHLETLAESNILFVEKSRQVLITWVCLAYILWRAKFHDHQLILVQSKREDDAKALTCVKESEPNNARLTFLETHLPDYLRNVDFSRRGATAKCNVYFDNGSHVWGIPEGGPIIRSQTPSLIFSDEAAFQPQFGEAYRATLPAIKGGGQALFVSSAEPGEFQQLVESDRKMIPSHNAKQSHRKRRGIDAVDPNYDAMATRVTDGDLVVCRLHYAADANKNPANRVGKAWLRSALTGYPDGMQDARWLKEMELQYSAGSGSRVLTHWHDWLISSNIFIDGDVDLMGAKLYGSYDHGWANPACYLVHAIYPDGMRRTIWEFYSSEVPVPLIARVIKGESITTDDGRVFPGNPYAGKELQKICDPEIMRRTQVMAKGPNRSIAKLFQLEGVFFVKGTSGDDGTVANWLTGNLWLDPMEPGYQIHRHCRNLIWELGRLQRKTWTPIQLRTRNQPETLLDKDNHAWDALKYWLKRFPVGVAEREKPVQVADFNYWKNLSKKKSRVKQSYTREFAR